MTELEGWLSLVHPEILVEFDTVVRNDEYLNKLPPSPLYFAMKKSIDELIGESGIEFEQRPLGPEVNHCVGYYYNDELVFKYCMLCINGGHNPRMTYWDDFTKHTNTEKEGICYNRGDCHETTDTHKFIGAVKLIIKQIQQKGKKVDEKV